MTWTSAKIKRGGKSMRWNRRPRHMALADWSTALLPQRTMDQSKKACALMHELAD